MKRGWLWLVVPALLGGLAGCTLGASAPHETPGAVASIASPGYGPGQPTSPVPDDSSSRAPSATPTQLETTPPAAAQSPLPTSDVTPVITFAGVQGDSIEVDGYVPGILEDGGSCTATLMTPTGAVTATAAAEPDATTVWCPQLHLARPVGDASGWAVTLSYSSAKHGGVSASLAVAAS